MSGHFAAAAREGLPEAALVHDRFHISAHLNDGSPVLQPPLFPSASSAVAAVHREENRRLPFRQAPVRLRSGPEPVERQGPEPAEGQKLGDDRLKGTQRLFGFDPDKLEEEPFGPELMAEGQAVRFAELKGSDLLSARAARPPTSLPSPFRLLAGRSRKCSGVSGITVTKAARGNSSKHGMAGRGAAGSNR